MGRYDGEDYSAEYYAQRSIERQDSRIHQLRDLVKQWAPEDARQLHLLARLGVGDYGEFSFEQAEERLREAGLSDPSAKLQAWVEAGYLYQRQPIWLKRRQPELQQSLKLSATGRILADIFWPADQSKTSTTLSYSY